MKTVNEPLHKAIIALQELIKKEVQRIDSAEKRNLKAAEKITKKEEEIQSLKEAIAGRESQITIDKNDIETYNEQIKDLQKILDI